MKKSNNKTVMLNSFQHLHLIQTLGKKDEILNQVQDDNKRDEALNKDAFRAPLHSGFTLIELLVVVLIIGILAAVAVPQYQVAVKKAQLMKYIPIVRALNQAEQAYYLANGKFTTNLAELDVKIPTEGCIYYQSSSSGHYTCGSEAYGIWGGIANAQAGDDTIRYLQFFADYDKYNMKAGDVACYSKGEISRKACRSLGPGIEQAGAKNSWNYIYTLSR